MPEIKQLVMSSIEGLQYDNVSIVMIAADEMPTVANSAPAWVDIFNIRIAPESTPRFWAIFSGVVALAVVNLLIAVAAILRWRTAVSQVRQGAAAA